jgi:hypothetical protein
LILSLRQVLLKYCLVLILELWQSPRRLGHSKMRQTLTRQSFPLESSAFCYIKPKPT